MECNSSSTNVLYNNIAVNFEIYSGSWYAPLAQSANPALLYNATYTENFFNSTVLNPLTANGTAQDGGGNTSALMEQVTTLCIPLRANFTVNNTWTNFALSRSVSVVPIDRLLNLLTLNHDNVVVVPGFASTIGYGLGTAPANWSSYARDYYRDNNMMTIIGSMMSWLQGGFQAYLANGDGLLVLNAAVEKNYLPLWNEPIIQSPNGVAVFNGCRLILLTFSVNVC